MRTSAPATRKPIWLRRGEILMLLAVIIPMLPFNPLPALPPPPVWHTCTRLLFCVTFATRHLRLLPQLVHLLAVSSPNGGLRTEYVFSLRHSLQSITYSVSITYGVLRISLFFSFFFFFFLVILFPVVPYCSFHQLLWIINCLSIIGKKKLHRIELLRIAAFLYFLVFSWQLEFRVLWILLSMIMVSFPLLDLELGL